MNRVILLNKRPIGKPTLNDFRFTKEEMPVFSKDKLLLKAVYVSVDPYLRGRMNDSKSYVPPFVLAKPIQSGCIAEVLESSIAELKKEILSLEIWNGKNIKCQKVKA
jgi:hypothetical protein